jgi:UDP-GlcNAc:undecaprenyl-phosphate GlcNAc-1-phosphate transferase
MPVINKALSAACLICLLILLPTGHLSALAWEWQMRWLYLVLISFFTVLLLAPFVGKLAYLLGAIDRPDPRKVHAAPTPRLGGVAIFCALVFTMTRNWMTPRPIMGIILGATIIFLLGVAEDCRGLSAKTRLFWQIVAALVAASSGPLISFPASLPLVRYALTVLWVVGIINAFNFLDGIDGLASGLGIICSVFMLGIAWHTGQKELAFVLAALTGACIGFLHFNWHPAEQFLGDSGSTLIGFLLAEFAIMENWSTESLASPLLILGIPIFDIIYITISRIRRGVVRNVRQWLDHVDRDHFHHRLMNFGMTVEESVGFVLLVNICLGLAAWTIHYTQSSTASVLLLLQCVCIFAIVVVLMQKGAARRAPHPGEQNHTK